MHRGPNQICPPEGRSKALLPHTSGGLLVTLQVMIGKCRSDPACACLDRLKNNAHAAEMKGQRGRSLSSRRRRPLPHTHGCMWGNRDDAAQWTSVSLHQFGVMNTQVCNLAAIRTPAITTRLRGSPLVSVFALLPWRHDSSLLPICSCVLFQGSFASAKSAADDSSRAGIARRGLW